MTKFYLEKLTEMGYTYKIVTLETEDGKEFESYELKDYLGNVAGYLQEEDLKGYVNALQHVWIFGFGCLKPMK